MFPREIWAPEAASSVVKPGNMQFIYSSTPSALLTVYVTQRLHYMQHTSQSKEHAV